MDKEQPSELKKEFIEDYKKELVRLYKTLLPVLEKGWTEDQVVDLLTFMEKNKKIVKRKTLNEVISLYNKRDTEKV